ncbi:MAG: LPS export ABC transporter periplasmic protein LptC [Pseudomonadota bacterium]
MKGWRVILLLVLLALGGFAFWYARTPGAAPSQAEQASETPPVAYDYEAHNVVLHQMDATGRLAFQVEAKEVTQLPDSGRITARGVTMYHDPPGTEIGSRNRWTLTANNGELPAEGGIVTLSGNVRAHGIPINGNVEMTVTTEHLLYDPDMQELSSDDVVHLAWAGNTYSGKGMRANIRTSDVELKSDVHGTYNPR